MSSKTSRRRRNKANRGSYVRKRGKSRIVAGVILVKIFAMVLAMVIIAACMVSYDYGYHRELTSDEVRQLAYGVIYDGRTRNGDVIEKSYMPKGGFSFDSDTMMLSEYYKETSLDGTFYLFSNDGKFLRHLQEGYPEALYPSNEWTVEEVLEFYRNSPESWAFYDSAYLEGKGYYICCTPDYKHCFAVKDDRYNYGKGTETGWLIIDGVYVTVLDEKLAYSMEPEKLIAQYRNGTWDGKLIRSKDYSTTAEILYNREEIYYSYERRTYSERQDPLGLAYDGYENPWWYDDELAEKYEVDDDSWEIVRDFGCESKIWMTCYPDLPDDFDTEQIVETENMVENTLGVLLEDDRLQRYSRTKLLDEWDLSKMSHLSLDGDAICQARNPFSPNDEIYYLDGDKLYALEEGGEVSLMLEHVGAVDHSYSLSGASIFILEEGVLYRYDIYDGKVYVADRDVLELDFGDFMAYRKADGYYTLYRERNSEGVLDYATQYLGGESLEYYAEYYRHLRSADQRD